MRIIDEKDNVLGRHIMRILEDGMIVADRGDTSCGRRPGFWYRPNVKGGILNDIENPAFCDLLLERCRGACESIK